MLKFFEIFVPTNRESTYHHDNKLKQVEKSLKLKETRMHEYHIEPILSLISLPKSPYQYGRPFEMKRYFVLTPQKKYNGTFVKSIVPFKEEDENRAITAWIYKEETPVDLTEQSCEITPEKYGPSLKLMKHFG